MIRPCIVNFAHGAWYPQGQARLRQSLIDIGYPTVGDLLLFQDYEQLGCDCSPHWQMPYAFKFGAVKQAIARGYRIILWLDASIWAVKPLDLVFEHIQEHGHIFFHSGFNCAQWTSDACLKQMDITRNDAEQMPMFSAGCVGLNLEHPRTWTFWTEANRYAQDGICLPGDWRNDQHQVSQDPRCQGHRHDQSILSLLAGKMGLEVLPGVGSNAWFQYYGNPDHTGYRYGGLNDMSQITDAAILLAQGM